ncbi:UDP-N-acetylmuramate--L-alanine ligase [Patescibacteria group bacterium]
MNKKIHLIGIGGIGMSGLAQILKEQENLVRGSDIEESEIIGKLRTVLGKENLEIGHTPKLLHDDTDKVIYSSAIPQDNPELVKAKELGIPTLTYAQAIKEFTENSYTIAVCGTHGKTTVTAFASLALLAGDKDPTVIIGSELNEFKGANYRLGKDKYFIVEACEYKRNFLNYSPNIIILTNLEAEHLDYFKDLDDYKNAFKEFIAKLPEDGFLIANEDDPNVMDVVKDAKAQVIFFSKNDELVKEINLEIPGEFNKLNALCALKLGQILNIDRSKMLDAFSKFKGAWRRFEILGKFYNMTVVSDYAHHPTAIEKTIQAAHQKYPNSKICCIFQPHQYNRTKNFLSEFGKAFKKADTVILPNIYEVRDKKQDIESVSIEDLVESIKKAGTDAVVISEYDKIKHFLEENRSEFDVLLIMGAGDIWKFGEYYLAQNPNKFCETCED